MKIAFITNLCTHYRYKLYKLLAENYNFDFYFFDEKERTKEDVKHLTVYKDYPKFCNLSVVNIIKELIKKRYDIIIKCTNNKWSFFGSFFVAKLTKAKFIVWHTIWYYPDTWQYKLFSWWLLKVLRSYTDAIVVYGEHGKNFLVDRGIDPNKIFIAWQTVDNELYGRIVSNEEINGIRERLNIGDKKVILYVGRLIRLKGIEYLLEAIKMLDRDKIIFVAIGDGELREEIDNYCRENNIDYRITGIISYDKLPPYYNLATVLCLPSITTKTFKEPWGLVVNEAFNQGCPVIATDAVGAAVGGLVKNGKNGFVVPERDAKALAEALSKVLSDEELRETLSHNARKEIKEWTYERQAKGFLDAVDYATEMQEFFLGKRLYGDDFEIDSILEWYKDEKEGYSHLVGDCKNYFYGYEELNKFHGYSFIQQKEKFGNVLSLGGAYGDELLPIINAIDGNIFIIEPSENLRRPELNGKKINYVTPEIKGKILFEDDYFDLITCFGTLHHIPNVTTIVHELFRVLKPNGYLLIREPITSMGDWRKQRIGLTKRERGILFKIMENIIENAGFKILKRRSCIFPLIPRVGKILKKSPYNSKILVRLDYLLSKIFSFNKTYHRSSILKKLGPQSYFWVLTK